MTDLDAVIHARLDEQPPVRTPPFTEIRRQARRRARRRNTMSSVCVLVVVAAVVVGAQIAADIDRSPERLAAPLSEPLVPLGAIAVYACPAAPAISGQEQLCFDTDDSEVVGELLRLVNEAAATPTDLMGCKPSDVDVPNVGVRFAYADGEGAAVQITDCILTNSARPERPAAYAPDAARTVARLLRPAHPRSTKQGCAAVIEDLEKVLAPGDQNDVAYAVQMAEATIAEQRGSLTQVQRAITDRIKPAVTSYLYNQPDVEGLRRGLEGLRGTCPG